MSARVLLRHGCPVCGTNTEEEYLKTTTITKNKQVDTYQYLKCLDNGEPFNRFEMNNHVFLVCPGCGVVLSGDYWETYVEDYMDESGD